MPGIHRRQDPPQERLREKEGICYFPEGDVLATLNRTCSRMPESTVISSSRDALCSGFFYFFWPKSKFFWYDFNKEMHKGGIT